MLGFMYTYHIYRVCSAASVELNLLHSLAVLDLCDYEVPPPNPIFKSHHHVLGTFELCFQSFS